MSRRWRWRRKRRSERNGKRVGGGDESKTYEKEGKRPRNETGNEGTEIETREGRGRQRLRKSGKKYEKEIKGKEGRREK